MEYAFGILTPFAHGLGWFVLGSSVLFAAAWTLGRIRYFLVGHSAFLLMAVCRLPIRTGVLPFVVGLPWRMSIWEWNSPRIERLKDYKAWAEKRGCSVCWDMPRGSDSTVSSFFGSGGHRGWLWIGPIAKIRPLREGVEDRLDHHFSCPVCLRGRTVVGKVTPESLSCPHCGHSKWSSHEILDMLARGKVSIGVSTRSVLTAAQRKAPVKSKGLHVRI